MLQTGQRLDRWELAAGWRRFLGVLAAVLAAASCRTAPEDGAAEISPGTYSTRFTLRLDRGVFRSTNYRSDRFPVLPIGTPVEVLGVRGDEVELRTDTGRSFVFEHVPKHTQDTLREAFDQVFTEEPVDLSSFSTEEREAIERGVAIPGMDREAVLAALGPPPAVGTISLDADVWRYWNTRFTTFRVRFDEDGRVTAIGR